MELDITGWVFPKNAKSVKKSKKQIEKILDEEVRDIVRHFEGPDGGWSLDKGAVTEVILHKILGFHISELLNHRLVEKGLKLKFKNGNFLIESSAPFQPIYFNENTGKIIVIENANENKDHVFKYPESKGWFQIGKL